MPAVWPWETWSHFWFPYLWNGGSNSHLTGFVRIKDINACKKLSVCKCSVNGPYDYLLINQSIRTFIQHLSLWEYKDESKVVPTVRILWFFRELYSLSSILIHLWIHARHWASHWEWLKHFLPLNSNSSEGNRTYVDNNLNSTRGKRVRP